MATQAECAEWLDISERRVRELIDEGVIARANGKGGYDLKTVVQQYVRNLREVAAGRGGQEAQQEKGGHDARRAAALADKAEMEVAEMRGQLVPADEIRDALHSAVMIMKTRILAVPTKAAARLGVKDMAAAEKVIRDEVVEALEGLAKVEVAGAPRASAA
jgi:phage terminase Nu1 subunit (DNA packaging protein)